MRFARLLPYLGCSFAVGVFSGFNNFSLPLWLGGIIGSYALISLLANTRGFLGSIISPLAGAWSDRVWAGWLGRRRPFILVGGLSAALLMALTPAAARLPLFAGLGLSPEAATVVMIVVVLFTIAVCFNMMDDIQKAMLADLTEGADRNTLSSLSVVTDMGGQVVILVIGFLLSSWLPGAGLPDASFAVAGALVAVGVLITVVGIREPAPEVWETQRERELEAAGPRLTPRVIWRRYRGAVMLGLTVFSYWFGVNAVLPLVSLYVRNILGASEAEAQLLPALLLLSTTVMAIPMGLLGTRFGKRRIIAVGYIIMCCAALVGLVITTKEQGAVLFLLAGIGNAASFVLIIPLLADLVPRHHMGAAAGLLAAAGGFAAPVSSLVAGTLADVFNERAIFAVMAVMVLIALALLSQVRTPSEEAAPAPLADEVPA
jgi:MFS family permease